MARWRGQAGSQGEAYADLPERRQHEHALHDLRSVGTAAQPLREELVQVLRCSGRRRRRRIIGHSGCPLLPTTMPPPS